MKANELRIGNLVFCHDKEDTVLGITDNDYYTEKHQHGVNNEDLNPIPLTEVWLIKLGFVKKVDYEQGDEEWGRLSTINTRRGLGLYQPDEYKEKHPNYFFVTFREDVGCGWCDLNEIEHVHQLQNLYFALTGEELTIK